MSSRAMEMLLMLPGLLVMVGGAEVLVRGASRLAAGVGVSPLIIGLTVVAFGTSAPELAVSIEASMRGQADIAIGNVVGSNIFNVLLILGASALIVPLVVSEQLIRLDVPVMIVVSVLLLLFGLDGNLGLVDGALLLLGLTGYIAFLIYETRRNPAAGPSEVDELLTGAKTGALLNVALVAGGLVLLVLGSHWFVESAVAMAEHFGVSELVIGLTIVAAGTSMPEVVTSIVAAIRGERDIAVGNVVGSNIFNILGVLGVSAVVSSSSAGLAVSGSVVGFDLPIMIAVAVACLPLFFHGGVIGRWKGALLLGYYGAYTAYLVLAAQRHDALVGFSSVMLYFALPLTALTLIGVVVLELRQRR